MGVGKLRRNPKAVPADEKIWSLMRQYGRGLLGLLVAVMIVHDVFGTHGFMAMRRTQNEIDKVKSNLNQLSIDNAALAQEVKDLNSDARLIEKIARDDLGLARRGEIIIRIPQGQLQDQSSQDQSSQDQSSIVKR